MINRVNSRQRMILLPNYKGLGNRLHLFSGLYFLSIRHRIPIISTFSNWCSNLVPQSALWHKVWTIRQNYTGQIVYVPDEGIAKVIIDSIDIHYLLHYSYLLIPKPFGKFQEIWSAIRIHCSSFRKCWSTVPNKDNSSNRMFLTAEDCDRF